MNSKHPTFDAARALADTLDQGRAEFQLAIRRIRWGEGPIFVAGQDNSFHAALTGGCAFELLLGWPSLARPSLEFTAY